MTGWAATVTYNPNAKAEFDRFRSRDDTLSLGVCNGCQLLALLGWVGEGSSGAGKRRRQEKEMENVVYGDDNHWLNNTVGWNYRASLFFTQILKWY